MVMNTQAEVNAPLSGGIESWRNTTDITRLKGRYVKFGNVVIIEGSWTGSANNNTVIFTVPSALIPPSTVSSGGSGVITISGATTKAEYTLFDNGEFKQAESTQTGQSGSFNIVYSLI